MKHLKLFETHEDYEDFVESGEMLRPNVSYCVTENEVHYNPIDWSKEYFTIESLEDNNTIYLKASNSSITKTILVSTDNGETWTEYVSSTDNSGTALTTLNNGDKLLVKGENSTYATSVTVYNQFKTTGQFKVKGNIMSLISGDSFANADELTENNTFSCLLRECTGLTSAENLVLPATTLTIYCYSVMFYGCTSLTTAPELPATILARQCYAAMFEGCTSLTTAPELPATTLPARSCYSAMFHNCTSLTAAPELPATTLVEDCYGYMFSGCTSLTTAPKLPATTLANYCYESMFEGCTSLTNITCLATDISATGCTKYWLKGVAANGTFTKASSMNSWTKSYYDGIPKGWTVQNASN